MKSKSPKQNGTIPVQIKPGLIIYVDSIEKVAPARAKFLKHTSLSFISNKKEEWLKPE